VPHAWIAVLPAKEEKSADYEGLYRNKENARAKTSLSASAPRHQVGRYLSLEQKTAAIGPSRKRSSFHLSAGSSWFARSYRFVIAK